MLGNEFEEWRTALVDAVLRAAQNFMFAPNCTLRAVPAAVSRNKSVEFAVLITAPVQPEVVLQFRLLVFNRFSAPAKAAR